MTRLRELLLAVTAFALSLAVATGCSEPSEVDTAASVDDEAYWSIAQPWTGPDPVPPTLFPARHHDRWGYIDKTGHLVIDFQYEEAKSFSDGLAAVRIDDLWGYIDEAGHVAVSPQYGVAYPFRDGLALVQASTGLVYIDRSGELVISSRPGRGLLATGFSEGVAPVSLDRETCGYIDTAGDLVIRLPHTDNVEAFSEGLAAVRQREALWGYIDRTGGWVIEPRFGHATGFSNGRAVVEYGYSKYAIIDKTGRLVVRLDYDSVWGLSEGRAWVVRGGGLAASEEGSDPLTADWSYGYMDESGELVIPAVFANAGSFFGGLARVEDENGKMAYIDLEGNYVWREE